MARRDYEGNAIPTTLANSINSTDLTINITASTGWPLGGAAGKFYVTVDRGLSTEERILVSSRSGTTLTVASVADRGVDGTSASGHASAAAIAHTFSGVDADEANEHVNDTSKDHHTQYLNNGRHDVVGRHTFGAALGTPGAGADIATAGGAGSGASPARSDHTHKIGAGAINSNGMFAAGVVNAAALASDAVTTVKILDNAVTTAKILDSNVTANKLATGAVTTAKILDANVTPAKFSANTQPYYVGSDPGAVGANFVWFDTGTRTIKVRNAANSGWELYGQPITTWVDYVPTWSNVTLGTGGTKYGHYFRLGDVTIVELGFTLGTGGDVTGTIVGSLPSSAKDVNHNGASLNRFTWLSAGWGVDNSTGAFYACVGVIDSAVDDATVRAFSTAGLAGSWDNNNPFDWGVNDHFHSLVVYGTP